MSRTLADVDADLKRVLECEPRVAKMLAELAALITERAELAGDDSNGGERVGSGRVEGERFVGRPMVARRGGKCCVCGRGIREGSDILWNGDRKQAAHAGCGSSDGGQRRG